MKLAKWQERAIEHFQQEAPKEACGLLVVVKGRKQYWPCRNLAEKPADQFILHPSDYAAAEDSGEVLAVVHSHPQSPAVPSELDRIGIERTELPWHIYSLLTNEWSGELLPSGYVPPLIGRQWSWGITDCWSLARDWYLQNGIEMRDWPRPATPDDFEREPMFDQCWKASGFRELQEEERLQKGDLLLMQIGNNALNHCGVYIGDQMVLHHCRNRLSSRDIYGGWLLKCTGRRLRHVA